MDAYSSSTSPHIYEGLPPVLIAANGARAFRRARTSVEAAGMRIGAELDLASAPGRIAIQPATSIVWVELEEDGGAPMDGLLGQLNADVRNHRYAAVVAAPAALVDPLMRQVDDQAVELVIDGSDADRATALALALSAHAATRLHDVASDQNSARLRQLSDEVSRIAATLARLSAGPTQAGRAAQPVADAADVPAVSAETVRAVIRARRLRARYFSESLFADPAWDMLLDLLQAEIAQLRVPVSSLCIAAAVPATTALRWLKTMTSEGMFVRRSDPHDGRRIFVELSPDASIAMRRYFSDVGQVAVV